MEDLELDICKIIDLVNQNKKLEAIKLICDETKTDLKTAEDVVDIIESGKLENLANISFSDKKRERCSISKSNEGIIVNYYDLNGVKSVVTPAHPLWNRVNILMNNDEMLQEYENSFNQQKKVL